MKQWIIAFLDRHCVADWRDWWHWWSTWALTALMVWNMLPPVLAGFISLPVQLGVSALLFGSVVLARLWDQPKLDGEE